jgi:hypothetical protein
MMKKYVKNYEITYMLPVKFKLSWRKKRKEMVCGSKSFVKKKKIWFILFPSPPDTDDLVLAILFTETLTPSLMDSQTARFTGIINNVKIDSKGLLNDLKKLFFFYARQRDKEMLIELLFQV